MHRACWHFSQTLSLPRPSSASLASGHAVVVTVRGGRPCHLCLFGGSPETSKATLRLRPSPSIKANIETDPEHAMSDLFRRLQGTFFLFTRRILVLWSCVCAFRSERQMIWIRQLLFVIMLKVLTRGRWWIAEAEGVGLSGISPHIFCSDCSCARA